MSLIGFVILLAVAFVAGSLGQALAGYSGGGCLLSIVAGFVGAFLGSWLGQQLHLPEPFPIMVDGEVFPLIWAIIGSAVFTAVLGFLARRRRWTY